jgi:hypothetical protein
MMQFSKTTIQSAADDVARSADIELVFNQSDLFVIADSSEAINEFETRLAAHTVVWEGPTALDAAGMLRTLTDLQGERAEFRPRHTEGWQARYNIVAR